MPYGADFNFEKLSAQEIFTFFLLKAENYQEEIPLKHVRNIWYIQFEVIPQELQHVIITACTTAQIKTINFYAKIPK